jgi:hypothetical protein
MWEVMERLTPYETNRDFPVGPLRQIEYISSGGRPSIGRGCREFGEAMMDLMKRCWQLDASKRPAFIDILHTLKCELVQSEKILLPSDDVEDLPPEGIGMSVTSSERLEDHQVLEPILRLSRGERGSSGAYLASPLLSSQNW